MIDLKPQIRYCSYSWSLRLRLEFKDHKFGQFAVRVGQLSCNSEQWHACCFLDDVSIASTGAHLGALQCFRANVHMSYCEYHGWWRHIEGGRRILYGDCIAGPTKFLIPDTCRTGSPETLTGAHMLIT